MYVDLVRNKLLEQQTVYQSIKENDYSAVCYKGYKDKEYGLRDENYTNRMRFAYYLLYERIDDENVIARLFEEELRDRETNAFQGIGNTIQILTCLLKRYDGSKKYEELFARAKNANFDCACGYDVDYEMNDDIYSNDLLDCIYLTQDLDYKDVMSELVEEWKGNIKEWNDSNRGTLIRFNTFLNRESENEIIYQEILTSVCQTGKTFDIVRAYKDVIHYYVTNKKYDLAYDYLQKLMESADFEEVKHIRLFQYVLEDSMEIICSYPDKAHELWDWAKENLQRQTNMFGNLFTKSIAAAHSVNDPYADELENDYREWKKKMGLK